MDMHEEIKNLTVVKSILGVFFAKKWWLPPTLSSKWKQTGWWENGSTEHHDRERKWGDRTKSTLEGGNKPYSTLAVSNQKCCLQFCQDLGQEYPTPFPTDWQFIYFHSRDITRFEGSPWKMARIYLVEPTDDEDASAKLDRLEATPMNVFMTELYFYARGNKAFAFAVYLQSLWQCDLLSGFIQKLT